MSKFNPGDLVEFIPGNYEIGENGKTFWPEGGCIIMDIEDDKYVLLVFNLEKISTDNFASYQIGQTILKLPVKDCDKQNCFRSLEI